MFRQHNENVQKAARWLRFFIVRHEHKQSGALYITRSALQRSSFENVTMTKTSGTPFLSGMYLTRNMAKENNSIYKRILPVKQTTAEEKTIKGRKKAPDYQVENVECAMVIWTPVYVAFLRKPETSAPERLFSNALSNLTTVTKQSRRSVGSLFQTLERKKLNFHLFLGGQLEMKVNQEDSNLAIVPLHCSNGSLRR